MLALRGFLFLANMVLIVMALINGDRKPGFWFLWAATLAGMGLFHAYDGRAWQSMFDAYGASFMLAIGAVRWRMANA
jgi:hypothetical protein